MTVREDLAVSALDVGALDGPDATAELLVGLAHQCRDRGTWGGQRALSYWDRLPDKVRTACYGGPTLGHWWERMSRVLGCSPPRDPTDRADLARALACPQASAVLDVLRTRTEVVCLRVRLAVQARRDRDAPPPDTTVDPVPLDEMETLL